MRAWYLDESPSRYQWGEVPDPEVGPADVRVRVRATALNHMDLWLTTGLPKPPRFPHVPGNDVAGVVDAVGERVTEWVPGDEVVINTAVVPADALARGDDSVLDPAMMLLGESCWGGHGEFCVVPGHQLERRPAGRSWAESASYPVCYTTAWRLLRRARLQPEDTVLVTGIGGGVATFALKWAVALGARVFVTSGDEAKLEQARRMGAAGGVNYRAGDWDKQLAKMTGGVDVVIDGTGGPAFKGCFSVLKPAGRLVIYGATAGNPPAGLEMASLFFRQARIIGSTMGSPAEFAAMLRFIAEHRIEPTLDQVFPFDQAIAAHQRLLAGEQMGKIVLRHG